jgi:small subunit ribosomal protein S18
MPRESLKDAKKKKSCNFCADKVVVLDYKDISKLKRFLSEAGKILPRRITGCCALHQRVLSTAVKRAREASLMGYVFEN